MNKLSRKERNMLRRILISALLLIFVKLLPIEGWLAAICYLIPYLIIGWDILYKAVRNIRNGQVFDENFLMAIATVGAFDTAE